MQLFLGSFSPHCPHPTPESTSPPPVHSSWGPESTRKPPVTKGHSRENSQAGSTFPSAILGMQAPGSAGTLVTLPGPRGEGTVSVFVGQETKAWGQHVFPENGGPWRGSGVCAMVGPGIFLPPTACPDTCPALGSLGSASLALISQGPRAWTSVTAGGEPGYRPARLQVPGEGPRTAGMGLQQGKEPRSPGA